MWHVNVAVCAAALDREHLWFRHQFAQVFLLQVVPECFLQVLQFPPAVQTHACWVSSSKRTVEVSSCEHGCVLLCVCDPPAGSPPLTDDSEARLIPPVILSNMKNK